jgi:hypothetical protein
MPEPNGTEANTAAPILLDIRSTGARSVYCHGKVITLPPK